VYEGGRVGYIFWFLDFEENICSHIAHSDKLFYFFQYKSGLVIAVFVLYVQKITTMKDFRKVQVLQNVLDVYPKKHIDFAKKKPQNHIFSTGDSTVYSI